MKATLNTKYVFTLGTALVLSLTIQCPSFGNEQSFLMESVPQLQPMDLSPAIDGFVQGTEDSSAELVAHEETNADLTEYSPQLASVEMTANGAGTQGPSPAPVAAAPQSDFFTGPTLKPNFGTRRPTISVVCPDDAQIVDNQMLGCELKLQFAVSETGSILMMQQMEWARQTTVEIRVPVVFTRNGDRLSLAITNRKWIGMMTQRYIQTMGEQFLSDWSYELTAKFDSDAILNRGGDRVIGDRYEYYMTYSDGLNPANDRYISKSAFKGRTDGFTHESLAASNTFEMYRRYIELLGGLSEFGWQISNEEAARILGDW